MAKKWDLGVFEHGKFNGDGLDIIRRWQLTAQLSTWRKNIKTNYFDYKLVRGVLKYDKFDGNGLGTIWRWPVTAQLLICWKMWNCPFGLNLVRRIFKYGEFNYYGLDTVQGLQMAAQLQNWVTICFWKWTIKTNFFQIIIFYKKLTEVFIWFYRLWYLFYNI